MKTNLALDEPTPLVLISIQLATSLLHSEHSNASWEWGQVVSLALNRCGKTQTSSSTFYSATTRHFIRQTICSEKLALPIIFNMHTNRDEQICEKGSEQIF